MSNKKDDFNVDHIVKVDNITDNAKKVDNKVGKCAIEKIKEQVPDNDKVKSFVYLDKDRAHKVKSYGK